MVRSHSAIFNVADPTLRTNSQTSGPKQSKFSSIKDLVSMVSLSIQLDEPLITFKSE